MSEVVVQRNRIAPAWAVAASTRRLALGLAISAALHVLAALGVSPLAVRPLAMARPLQVEIQRAVDPDVGAELIMPGASDFTRADSPSPPPTAEQPQQAPAGALSAGEAVIQFPFPLDKYFTASEVTVRATQINEIELVYPQPAYDKRIAGKLTLQILINEQGSVDRVSVLEAMPPGVFETAALAAARALKFSPALIYGRPVKSQKTFEVIFNPSASTDTP